MGAVEVAREGMGVGMGLDRDELAARCYLTLLTPRESTAPVEDWDYGILADTATKAADALLSRLAPAPSPSLADGEWRDAAKQPAPTEPRRTVGAVVVDSLDSEWIVTAPDMARVASAADAGDVPVSSHWTFSRWATREECEKHRIAYVARPMPGASPAASPAAYVPNVGDVVTIPSHHSDLPDELVGRVVSVRAGIVAVRVNDAGDFTTFSRMNRRKADAHDESDDYVEPATAAERVAAGLPPASCDSRPVAVPVDREGLIAFIRRERIKWMGNSDTRKIDEVSADAALAFLKANGGAS